MKVNKLEGESGKNKNNVNQKVNFDIKNNECNKNSRQCLTSNSNRSPIRNKG